MFDFVVYLLEVDTFWMWKMQLCMKSDIAHGVYLTLMWTGNYSQSMYVTMLYEIDLSFEKYTKQKYN